jgi:lysophospholipase L1-like esterase
VPTEASPAWLGVEAGEGPKRRLLLWSDVGWTDYNNTSGGAPLAYRIETSSDWTDGSDGTWSQVKHPSHTPILVGGGEFATQGRAYLAQWLELNPDIVHFLVAYGTNDSWGDKDPVAVGFEATLESIVGALLDGGRVPILARIPYASTAHSTVERFNEVVERVRAKHGLPCGPDPYAWFRQHPERLSSDGVHPSSAGYTQMNRLWAEAVDVLYPAN